MNIEKKKRCGKWQLRKVLSVDCFYVCSVTMNLSIANECVCVYANMFANETKVFASQQVMNALYLNVRTDKTLVNLINCVI